jgi:hypothetical protein
LPQDSFSHLLSTRVILEDKERLSKQGKRTIFMKRDLNPSLALLIP